MAASIREHGVLQPVLVKPVTGGGYELVSGERRLRAAERAGLNRVPSILVDPDEGAGSLTIALVENVQRTDLNAIELARAYLQLQEEFGRTQEDISRTVGKSRPHVANTLRLLDLDDSMQEAILDGKITAGHARAILMAPEDARLSVYQKVISNELSVRQAERAARSAERRKVKSAGKTGGQIGSREDPSVVAMLREMELALESELKRKVRIERYRSGKGKMALEFYGDRDLEALVQRLRGE